MKKIMLGFASLLPAGALFAQATTEVRVQLDQLKGQLDNVVAAQGGSTFEFVSSAMVAGKSVKGAPYSAEAVNETTQVLADGNRIVRRNSTKLYRDSEGRERREESISRGASAPAEPARTVFITDPVASFSATLDTNKRTAHKMPMSNRVMFSPTTVGVGGARGGGGGMGGATAVAVPRVAAGPTPAHAGEHIETYTVHSTGVGPAVATITTPSGGGGGRGGVMRTSGDQPAPKIEQLGKQMFDGVEAEGTRTTVTIPAGSPLGNERAIEVVSESWYSKELQMTVMSKRSDPRTGETIYRLTGITRNEPLRSLFEVPPDYTVTEPQMRQMRKEE